MSRARSRTDRAPMDWAVLEEQRRIIETQRSIIEEQQRIISQHCAVLAPGRVSLKSSEVCSTAGSTVSSSAASGSVRSLPTDSSSIASEALSPNILDVTVHVESTEEKVLAGSVPPIPRAVLEPTSATAQLGTGMHGELQSMTTKDQLEGFLDEVLRKGTSNTQQPRQVSSSPTRRMSADPVSPRTSAASGYRRLSAGQDRPLLNPPCQEQAGMMQQFSNPRIRAPSSSPGPGARLQGNCSGKHATAAEPDLERSWRESMEAVIDRSLGAVSQDPVQREAHPQSVNDSRQRSGCLQNKGALSIAADFEQRFRQQLEASKDRSLAPQAKPVPQSQAPRAAIRGTSSEAGYPRTTTQNMQVEMASPLPPRIGCKGVQEQPMTTTFDQGSSELKKNASSQGQASLQHDAGQNLNREVCRFELDSWVLCANISYDGKWLCMASDDGTARVYGLDSKRLCHRFDHGDWVWTAEFSPNSQKLCTSSSDGCARVFDIDSGQERNCLRHAALVRSASFSPAGDYLCTASNDRNARIFNFEEESDALEVGRFEHSGWVLSAGWSPDGQQLCTAADDMTARIFDVNTGSQVQSILHSDWIRSVKFHPDAKRLCTASDDKIVRIFDADSRRIVQNFQHSSVVSSASFSPDGNWLCTACNDAHAYIFDVGTGKELLRFNHGGRVCSANFSPDGRRLCTSSEDGCSRVFGYAMQSILTLVAMAAR